MIEIASNAFVDIRKNGYEAYKNISPLSLFPSQQVWYKSPPFVSSTYATNGLKVIDC